MALPVQFDSAAKQQRRRHGNLTVITSLCSAAAIRTCVVATTSFPLYESLYLILRSRLSCEFLSAARSPSPKC